MVEAPEHTGAFNIKEKQIELDRTKLADFLLLSLSIKTY